MYTKKYKLQVPLLIIPIQIASKSYNISLYKNSNIQKIVSEFVLNNRFNQQTRNYILEILTQKIRDNQLTQMFIETEISSHRGSNKQNNKNLANINITHSPIKQVVKKDSKIASKNITVELINNKQDGISRKNSSRMSRVSALSTTPSKQSQIISKAKNPFNNNCQSINRLQVQPSVSRLIVDSQRSKSIIWQKPPSKAMPIVISNLDLTHSRLKNTNNTNKLSKILDSIYNHLNRKNPSHIQNLSTQYICFEGMGEQSLQLLQNFFDMLQQEQIEGMTLQTFKYLMKKHNFDQKFRLLHETNEVKKMKKVNKLQNQKFFV